MPKKHVLTFGLLQGKAPSCSAVPFFPRGWQVRDLLTTSHEQQLVRGGQVTSPTLKRDAVLVDAVVNTIGFPLVGGPAGGLT